MGIRLSVQQQNAETKAAIQRCAFLFVRKPAALTWLVGLLESHQICTEFGILAQLSETPEQEGNLCSGIWVTQSHDFWAFRATVSRATAKVLSVEQFENVSSTVSATAHSRGTGQSFGFLAIQVLNEVLVANPSLQGTLRDKAAQRP